MTNHSPRRIQSDLFSLSERLSGDSRGDRSHLQDVIPEVQTGAGFPFSRVLKELVEIMPVTLHVKCQDYHIAFRCVFFLIAFFPFPFLPLRTCL